MLMMLKVNFESMRSILKIDLNRFLGQMNHNFFKMSSTTPCVTTLNKLLHCIVLQSEITQNGLSEVRTPYCTQLIPV